MSLLLARLSLKLYSLRYLEPVKVKVMPNAEEGESKEFIVHRRLICHYSGYFAKIFGDDSSMNCAKKDNTSPRIFELFVQFIYAQDFDYKWKAWVAPEEDPYFPLVELYRLARELEVPALMNKTISTIVKLFKDFELKVFVSPQIINYIYGITNKGDPLRRVVVAMFAFHNRKKTLKFDKNLLLPAEFDAELRDMYIERLDNPNMTEPPSSAYHIHEVESDEDECIMVEKTQVWGYGSTLFVSDRRLT